MLRKIAKFSFVLVLCMLFAVPVSAARQGSFTLKNLENEVVLYPVADENGVPAGDFAGAVDRLTQNHLTPAMAKTLYDRIGENHTGSTSLSPDPQGEMTFSSLEEGWYLVVSRAEKPEFAPFLVAIPMIINGESMYDLEAEPKVESPVTPPTTSTPENPRPNIPQTGVVLWPKYLLLMAGALLITVGVVETVAGREKRHE
ncbi:MAG: hypothetical protein IJN07_01410 [Clostridia bacterium]|nr:hypothetical protein [Clostridia bacterium]